MSIRAIVLREMGIECEEETYRALRLSGISDIRYFGLSELFSSDWKQELKLDRKTWIWIPGGFSFSDDFSAGRLMAHWLSEQGFLDEVLKQGAHITGVCNGFQVLCHTNLFGEGVRLKSNLPKGFVNRWVELCLEHEPDTQIRLPVRHGEGRLVVEVVDGEASLPLESNVEVFLRYKDATFDNGSFDKIAGLYTKQNLSHVFGMMPHPEVALKPIDDPSVCGTSRMPKFRSDVLNLTASGMHIISFMKDKILKGIET